MIAIFVHFNIQKLKNKHTFIQTEKAKSSHFDRTRGDTKQIFPTLIAFQGMLKDHENCTANMSSILTLHSTAITVKNCILARLYICSVHELCDT